MPNVQQIRQKPDHRANSMAAGISNASKTLGNSVMQAGMMAHQQEIQAQQERIKQEESDDTMFQNAVKLGADKGSRPAAIAIHDKYWSGRTEDPVYAQNRQQMEAAWNSIDTETAKMSVNDMQSAVRNFGTDMYKNAEKEFGQYKGEHPNTQIGNRMPAFAAHMAEQMAPGGTEAQQFTAIKKVWSEAVTAGHVKPDSVPTDNQLRGQLRQYNGKNFAENGVIGGMAPTASASVPGMGVSASVAGQPNVSDGIATPSGNQINNLEQLQSQVNTDFIQPEGGFPEQRIDGGPGVPMGLSPEQTESYKEISDNKEKLKLENLLRFTGNNLTGKDSENLDKIIQEGVVEKMRIALERLKNRK